MEAKMRKFGRNAITGLLEDIQRFLDKCIFSDTLVSRPEGLKKRVDTMVTGLIMAEPEQMTSDDVFFLATDWFPKAIISEDESGELVIATGYKEGPGGHLVPVKEE